MRRSCAGACRPVRSFCQLVAAAAASVVSSAVRYPGDRVAVQCQMGPCSDDARAPLNAPSILSYDGKTINQNSLIGSIRSARIKITPEIRMTPPTAYATGSIFAVST